MWRDDCCRTSVALEELMRRLPLVVALLAAGAMLALSPAPAVAQPRHGGAGHVVVGGGYRPYHGGYYRPYYRPYYYRPYYWGGYGFWGGYGWGPYWGQPYPGPWYWGGVYDTSASVKLEVTPRETEVYIDGYRAGIVDEFDGFFQRMRLGPGDHELVLYLDGYRSVKQTLRLASGSDIKVRHTMVPLGPGEAPEPRPEAPPIPPQGTASMRGQPPVQAMPPAQGAPPAAPREWPAPTSPAQGFGAISIRVQPADAEVWIDGEPWSGPTDQGPLVVQVAPGTHRVEVRRDGHVPFATEVRVEVRRATPLNVSLPREQ